MIIILILLYGEEAPRKMSMQHKGFHPTRELFDFHNLYKT
jgi:hypothetical protein